MGAVAIYIRVSTLDQAREGYSLAAQEKALRSWCERDNHPVYKVYADEGISGKNIKGRPAMQELMSAAAAGEFDIVIAWALSRLTRSVADLYNIWSTLSSHNVALISYTESFDTGTPTGRAMMGLLGVFAQMERELTSERVIAAMQERAAQGKRMTNEVLGYDLAGKDNLDINEREAERVRYIYARYTEHRNLSAVAELCRLRGYHGKRGRVFKPWQIKVLLTRPIYVGYNTFMGSIYRGIHEPIIPQREWDKVQRLLGTPTLNELLKTMQKSH